MEVVAIVAGVISTFELSERLDEAVVRVVTGVALGTLLDVIAVELVVGAIELVEIIDDEFDVSVVVDEDEARPFISIGFDIDANKPVNDGDVDSTSPISKSAITLTSS